jgi:membrane-associated phospholipid phosphatase
MDTAQTPPIGWRDVADSLNRPYRVTIPMVVLVLLVPGYLVLARSLSGRTLHSLELPLDGLIPIEPVWALVYGALYLFLIVLPVLVVREPEHIRRTVLAYVTVWLAAFACFWMYPTVAPRPDHIEGDGFAAWGLRFLYQADLPYNCFPSIHVAHSFVSALACRRVHRGVGGIAMVCAILVAASTLFTKQHYVLDVVAGVGLAVLASKALLGNAPSERIEDLDRRLAPLFASGAAALAGVGIACYWVAYRVG